MCRLHQLTICAVGSLEDAVGHVAKTVAQIWQAVQCISKAIFALEQKVSIMNFDMEFMIDNLKKVCALFELMEGPYTYDQANPLAHPSVVGVSRTVLQNSPGRVMVAPVTQ